MKPVTFTFFPPEIVGRDSVVRIRTRYYLERSGDRIPVGAKFSAPVLTSPGFQPVSTKWVPALFPGGKATGVWRHPRNSIQLRG
jgi:hypothetical protein